MTLAVHILHLCTVKTVTPSAAATKVQYSKMATQAYTLENG
jgi:hypothetical protein